MTMLIAKLTDADLFGGEPRYLNEVTRKGARGILIDDKKRIAMMYMSSVDCYKLPGGGIELNETIEEAFLREIKEETGYDATIIGYLGEIEEHKAKAQFLQVSYCFLATKKESVQSQSLTDWEQELGFQLTWMTYQQAFESLQKSYLQCEDYFMKFMIYRDFRILDSVKGDF